MLAKKRDKSFIEKSRLDKQRKDIEIFERIRLMKQGFSHSDIANMMVKDKLKKE
jgi:hypothetical protein